MAVLDSLREMARSWVAPYVTIRLVPADLVMRDEAMPDGRPPMEIVEYRPDLPALTHGTERGIAPHELRDRARSAADRLGVPYIDPSDVEVMALLARAEAA